MTFTESIKTCLSKLTDFSGRAGRSEYWWFCLFLLLVLALLVAGIVLASALIGTRVPYGALVVLLVPLSLAWVSAQVRRLRDAGLSLWWTLLNLIPCVGVPLVLTLLPSRGQEGGETTSPASLSTFSLMMATGWGARAAEQQECALPRWALEDSQSAAPTATPRRNSTSPWLASSRSARELACMRSRVVPRLV